jgi:hypothetical protein
MFLLNVDDGSDDCDTERWACGVVSLLAYNSDDEQFDKSERERLFGTSGQFGLG